MTSRGDFVPYALLAICLLLAWWGATTGTGGWGREVLDSTALICCAAALKRVNTTEGSVDGTT